MKESSNLTSIDHSHNQYFQGLSNWAHIKPQYFQDIFKILIKKNNGKRFDDVVLFIFFNFSYVSSFQLKKKKPNN